MQLTVIRHGQTEWNQANKMQGWRDSKLTPLARQQLTRLPKIDCDVIYASDLGRAMATARILANKNRSMIRLDKRLRERDFGVLSGFIKGSAQLPCAYWQAYENRYRQPISGVPGVESEVCYQSRIEEFISQLRHRHKSQKVLLVCHGEWLRALLNIFSGRESWHQGQGILANGRPVQLIIPE